MGYRVAVLISGGGSTLRNLLMRCRDGRLRGVEICGVVASRECPGLVFAEEFSIPHEVVQRGKGDQPFNALEFSARVDAELESWQPDLIVLGGFLSPYVPQEKWRHQVINVHPALLPAFGGKGMFGERVHEAVIKSGCKLSGASVHLVTADYDSGPIIAQRSLAVLEDDTAETLGERVRRVEAELLPEVIQWFADGRVRFDADGRPMIQGRELLRM